jgi:hypothetical protein
MIFLNIENLWKVWMLILSHFFHVMLKKSWANLGAEESWLTQDPSIHHPSTHAELNQ